VIPKAVILDLDGTLLTAAKTVSPRNLAALQAARAGGMHLIFATARPPRSTQFPGIDLAEMGAMIYYNGAIFHCGENGENYNHAIPSRLAREVIACCLELDPEANISIETNDQWFCSKVLDYATLMKVNCNPEVVAVEALGAADCTKILLWEFDAADELIRQFGAELHILVTDGGQLVQIMSREASKENAARQVLQTWGLTLADAVCFGDDHNDVGLFETCGHSVAMGNGITLLKDMASEVTASHEEDGVALVLERMLAQAVNR
jgi:Cof subfamily protein (haloacid dehalogenase superfamily)